jgi:uncharacterized protein
VFFHLRDLEVRALPFSVEIPAGEIEFLDPKLRQAGPLVASGAAELTIEALGEIRVKGHVKVRMEGECDRCLEMTELPIDSDFELFYRPVEEGSGGEERLLDDGEAQMGFYENEGLELNEVLREFVLLTLPMQRLCGTDCVGICPVCGQNRNKQDCQCQRAVGDDRWSVLKEVVLKDLKN